MATGAPHDVGGAALVPGPREQSDRVDRSAPERHRRPDRVQELDRVLALPRADVHRQQHLSAAEVTGQVVEELDRRPAGALQVVHGDQHRAAPGQAAQEPGHRGEALRPLDGGRRCRQNRGRG